jgi:hypothetical protein
MRFIVLIFLFLNSCYLNAQTKKPLKILFLGNSYTAANNLTGLITDMCNNAGDSVTQITSSGGGQTLANHSAPGSPSMNEIATGSYDIVVLQEQSQIPSFTDAEVNTYFFPYVKYLDSCIKAANPCTKTMLYMTWGRKNGDNMNCANWPPVCTYQGMDSLLRKRYLEAADSNNCMVSPAGAVWRYIRQKYPDIDLYEPDNSHPSFAGSYATAATFYSAIFKKSPSNFSISSPLPDSTVAKIKTAVDAVVVPQSDLWQLDAYKTKARFSYKATGIYVVFKNTTENALSYQWFFGDGDTAELENPVHAYLQGKYKITLIAKGCYGNDTMIYELNMPSETSLNSFSASNIQLVPVPAQSELTITNIGNVSSCYAISANGQQIELPVKVVDKTYVADINNINTGIYTLLIQKLDGKTMTVRFIKE